MAAGGERRAVVPRATPTVASSLHRRLLKENFYAAKGDDLFPGLEKRETPWWAGLKSTAGLNRTHNFAWARIFSSPE
uniref:Uncharacterized protein n=1 Tax=Oryza meridionalis TaxID=40149 RepID=A0A0E0EQA8_9ORYZ